MPTAPRKSTPSDTSERFQKVDSEIAGVKKNISGLQVEFQSAISEVKGDIKSLNIGQTLLQQHQAEGFRDIKDVLSERNSAPTKIGAGMLVSVVSLVITAGVVAVAAFWAAVVLLVSPLQEEIQKHVILDGHPNTLSRLVGVEHDLVSLHRNQEEIGDMFKDQVDSLRRSLERLNLFALEHTKEQGSRNIRDEWNAANQDLAKIQQNLDVENSVVIAEKIATLTAKVELLTERTKSEENSK
jgi:hypothetical protein